MGSTNGISLSNVEAVVPLDVVFTGTMALDVRQADLHAPRATVAAVVRRFGGRYEAQLVGIEADDEPHLIVQAHLPIPVLGLVPLNVTFKAILTKTGRLSVSVVALKADVGVPFPLPGRKYVVKLLREAISENPMDGFRAGTRDGCILELDVQALARQAGVTIRRPSELTFAPDGLTLLFRTPKTRSVDSRQPARKQRKRASKRT